jgi:23S rRNA (uracil1939-C5)-methyltransferase
VACTAFLSVNVGKRASSVGIVATSSNVDGLRYRPQMAEQLQLTATAMASNGLAVSRHPSGQVVFLEGALPGEEVIAMVADERRHYLTARVTRVVTASAARLEPRCGHVTEGCGGCQWQHVGVDAQVQFKRQILIDTIRRIGRIECPELSETVVLEPWNFRTSLRATVVDARAALRRARSNEGIPVPGCLVVHPLLAELLDGRRYPGAEEVLLRCGARTGERLVSVRPRRIVADVPGDVRSDWVHELAAGRTWRLSAGSFFQSRPDGVDALADLVVAAASDVEPTVAVDLYSGVGVFAGVLAARGWSVTAVEGSDRAVRDAEANLAGLGVRVVRADVTRWHPEQAALVVADPSRAGLGSRGVSVVTGTGAVRVVLISCDAASLARDALLLRSDGYSLTSVTPVDLFPHTFHIEVVSVFDRN